MIPPKAPATTTLRNARTNAPRDGSPAGTSESPVPGSSTTCSSAPRHRSRRIGLVASHGRRSRIVRRSTARQPCACHTDRMAETGARVDGRRRARRVRRSLALRAQPAPRRLRGLEHAGRRHRRDGRLVLAGLTREVEEETGLRVTLLGGPALRGRRGRARPRLGHAVRGPPGGSIRGRAAGRRPRRHRRRSRVRPRRRARAAMLERCHWVGEPLAEWLAEQWGPDSVRGTTTTCSGTGASPTLEVTTPRHRDGAVRD